MHRFRLILGIVFAHGRLLFDVTKCAKIAVVPIGPKGRYRKFQDFRLAGSHEIKVLRSKIRAKIPSDFADRHTNAFHHL